MTSWTYSPAGVDKSTWVASLCVVVKFSCSGLWLSGRMRAVSPISTSLPREDEASCTSGIWLSSSQDFPLPVVEHLTVQLK